MFASFTFFETTYSRPRMFNIGSCSRSIRGVSVEQAHLKTLCMNHVTAQTRRDMNRGTFEKPRKICETSPYLILAASRLHKHSLKRADLEQV